jgi:competence protein ComEC
MPLSSQLLKVAHHGGRTSSSAEFLARVSPSIALVTVESGNPANLPSPEVLGRLLAAGAKTYRTDIAGAVTVELRGAQLSVRAYGTSPAD